MLHMVNLIDKNPLPLMILEGIKALYIRLFGEKHIDPQLMRLHEIEADAYAVRHTRNLLAAVNCFYRLSGGDMQGASHKFDLFGDKYPAISWSERIVNCENLLVRDNYVVPHRQINIHNY